MYIYIVIYIYIYIYIYIFKFKTTKVRNVYELKKIKNTFFPTNISMFLRNLLRNLLNTSLPLKRPYIYNILNILIISNNFNFLILNFNSNIIGGKLTYHTLLIDFTYQLTSIQGVEHNYVHAPMSYLLPMTKMQSQTNKFYLAMI